MNASERLRENIRKYRTEERLLAVDPTSFRDESDACEGLMNGNSLTNLSVPQSPCIEMNAPMKLAEMSSVERRLKLQAEVCLCISIYQIFFDIQVKAFSRSSHTTNSSFNFRARIRKKPTFRHANTGFPAKWRLGNERRNSILMTCHQPDLGSATDWSCRVGNLLQPIRSTTQIWVEMRHQYGISALVSEASFGGETIVGVAKCRLFSQATLEHACRRSFCLLARHDVTIFWWNGDYSHSLSQMLKTAQDHQLWQFTVNLDARSILLDLSLYSFNDCNCSFSLGESASQSFTCDQNDRSQITSDKRPRAGPWNVQWRHCRDFIIRGTEKTWRGKRRQSNIPYDRWGLSVVCWLACGFLWICVF